MRLHCASLDGFRICKNTKDKYHMGVKCSVDKQAGVFPMM